MTKLRRATSNFCRIEPLVDAADRRDGYVSIVNEPYTRLVVERLGWNDYKGRPVYYIAHYSEMNGDLMADPCIEFSIDYKAGTIEPQNYRNDYLGKFDEVYIERDGKTLYSQRLRVSLDKFMYQWLKNIKEQGFFEKI